MSFAIQALSAKYLVENEGKLNQMLIDVPKEVDQDVAKRKLAFMGKEIDILTNPPKERYERVLKRNPQLFQEIPNRHIANYLRMSAETLSRLKKS